VVKNAVDARDRSSDGLGIGYVALDELDPVANIV